jgi:phage-related tail fiber protein
MSDPQPYTVSYNFSGFQANSPTSPLPASKVDNEFDSIAAAVAVIVTAIKDIRRSDGALKNNIVTYDSLAESLQLTFDPTNGEAVAAAIAVAQASATAAAASNVSAGTNATNAANSAVAAAASASSINLTNYLSKAGNLAGLGNNDTALANIGAAKNDGSNAIGRLAPLTGITVTDWNNAVTSGWFCGAAGTANAPDTASIWLSQVIAIDAFAVTQIAYNITGSGTSVSAVNIVRRQSYNNAGVRTWWPWQSGDPVPVGSTVWINATTPPAGFIKENGALLSRASYPALWAFANASGNIVAEASWAAGNNGAFSTGDLSTNFRIPDSRGEFIRGYDDSRGVDSGRVLGANQSDLLKDHTHNYDKLNGGLRNDGTQALTVNTAYVTLSTGGVNGGLGGAETRPRNNAKLACIKF